ncbi:MAG: hypothetical protein K2I22_01005 [Lachnospiraceae bacterium]|nr:hypothetical protein [Lachnospiraceae bacterium]
MNRPVLTSPIISENIRGFKAVAAMLIVLFFCTACGRTAAADSAAQILFQKAVGAGIKEAKGISFAENDFAAAWQEKVDEYTAKEYTCTAEITVDNGRELQLVLHGTKDEYFYLIHEIEVFDGEKLIQSGLVKEAVMAEWEDGNFYAESISKDGGLSVADMNFDGAGDIAIQGWVANANVPCYYWLWDEEAGQFTYAFCICNAEIDEAQKQIISHMRESAVCHSTYYYAYDEDGKLQNIGYELEDYGKLIKSIYELQNGDMKLVSEEALAPMQG